MLDENVMIPSSFSNSQVSRRSRRLALAHWVRKRQRTSAPDAPSAPGGRREEKERGQSWRLRFGCRCMTTQLARTTRTTSWRRLALAGLPGTAWLDGPRPARKRSLAPSVSLFHAYCLHRQTGRRTDGRGPTCGESPVS